MSDFDRNVFVNCPFDEDFRPLLESLLFTICYLGFTPRISSEVADSGEARIQKICRLISQSKYGIHDLSRIESSTSGELYRMNMPFELGLDIGSRVYRRGRYGNKCHLILEAEPYRYQAAISDLSNSDIKYHENDPAKATKSVRDWFAENGHTVRSASSVWSAYTDFQAVFFEERKSDGFEDDEIYQMPVAEYLRFLQDSVRN